ncbi:hypothetical protein [Micromonospora sp. NPDC049891]|uniref:hypothetical protein n=1 Tax=Micromonospora sp. NPDC049891 TaxID=3155655 RepID=UPI0033E858EF
MTIIWKSEDEFLERYGDSLVSDLFIPLFSNDVLSIYKDRRCDVTYVVEAS